VDADQTPAQDERGAEEKRGGHAAPDGAGLHPLIDLSRDPNPGKANHAKPDDAG
jgi:hypothetical protein